MALAIKNPDLQENFGDTLNRKGKAEDCLKVDDFQPSRRHVLVRPLRPDVVTAGGVVIPEQAQTDKSLGHVTRVNAFDTDYAIGDLLYYRYGAGQMVEIGGVEFVILQYFEDLTGDILGKWDVASLTGTLLAANNL